MSWTLIGVIGSYIAWKNLSYSRRELRRVEKLNGNRFGDDYTLMRVISFGHYRNDVFRLAKHLSILAIGAISCIVPPTHPQPQVTGTQIVVTGGLFTIALLLVMASTLDKRQRELMTRELM